MNLPALLFVGLWTLWINREILINVPARLLRKPLTGEAVHAGPGSLWVIFWGNVSFDSPGLSLVHEPHRPGAVHGVH